MQRHYIRPLGKIKVPRPHGVSRFLWPFLPILPLCGLLGACASGPRLDSVAAPSEPSVTLTEGGIRLTILPNTWSSYPGNLARYYTPVEIRIQNTRDEEVQIRYEDFVALDDRKNQYRAVPPAEVARALFGALDRFGPTGGPHPLLLAGPWFPYGPRYWGPYGPWGYWDPYYYPYVWPRSGAQDVLLLGLRSGPLLPAASVQGFLYFQQATTQATSLTLSWTPRSPSGAPLATLATQFRIIR